MIGEWVVVGEAPATVLCRAGLSTPVVSGALMLPVLTRVGQIRRPLSAPGLAGAETASVTIDLDNAGGAVTRRFGGRPPVRAVARVMSAQGDELFAGVVTSCSLSDVASMTIEAGLRRPLTDTVPLRTSVVWGGTRMCACCQLFTGRHAFRPCLIRRTDACSCWPIIRWRGSMA